VLLACFLVALPAWPLTAAHAVTFGAPASFSVGFTPASVAVSHFNGDSDPDLAVANEWSNSVSVLLGGSGASFTARTDIGVGSNPTSVVVGHFNDDSDPDLAVANEGADSVSVLLGGAGASFTGPTDFAAGNGPQKIGVGDFDGDSDPDLAVTNKYSNDVSVLLGGAGGTFTGPTSFATGLEPQGAAVGKLNGDADLDLAVANTSSHDVSVLLGGAGGTFTGPASFATGGVSALGIVAGDFNGDSKRDLAVANELSHNVSVLLGDGTGSFTAPASFAVGALPDGMALGELNGDSDPDLAVASQGSDNVSVLLGGPGGSFAGPRNFAAGDGPTWVAVGDFNGDSLPDLAVTNEISHDVTILVGTPPETTIESGPAGVTNDPTPMFTFSSNDQSATFKCRVDGGTFSSCTSPHTTTSLSNGAHTFEVRATDDAGRTDASPAARSFTVDTAPPATPVLTGTEPGPPANDNNPRVKGTAEASSTVRLYRAPTTADCTPLNLLAIDTAATFGGPGLQAAVADNSTTTFRATATDQAGNVSGCSSSSITYVELSPPPVGPPGPSGGGTSTGGTPRSGGTSAGGWGIALGGAGPADTNGPVMAIVGKTVRMGAGGVVTLALSCPASEAGGCEGALALDAFVRLRASKTSAGRARSRLRRVKLGESSFRIAGGQSAKVNVRVSKRRQRLVRRLKKLRVVATITARDQAGNAQTTKKTLTLKPASTTRKP
jgi:predicted NUDIX family NTP pyrophosphohydrolase